MLNVTVHFLVKHKSILEKKNICYWYYWWII